MSYLDYGCVLSVILQRTPFHLSPFSSLHHSWNATVICGTGLQRVWDCWRAPSRLLCAIRQRIYPNVIKAWYILQGCWLLHGWVDCLCTSQSRELLFSSPLRLSPPGWYLPRENQRVKPPLLVYYVDQFTSLGNSNTRPSWRPRRVCNSRQLLSKQSCSKWINDDDQCSTICPTWTEIAAMNLSYTFSSSDKESGENWLVASISIE
jgi:hypothetical protein